MFISAIAILSATLIGLSTFYLWWTYVRVIRLRQDLYDVRDHLFDAAHRHSLLSDPAYCQTRNTLNAMAHMADYLSPRFVTELARLARRGPMEGRPVAVDPILDAEVLRTYRWLEERLFHYLMRECLSGWLIGSLVGFANIEQAGRFSMETVCTALPTPAFEWNPDRTLLAA